MEAGSRDVLRVPPLCSFLVYLHGFFCCLFICLVVWLVFGFFFPVKPFFIVLAMWGWSWKLAQKFVVTMT